MSAMLAIIVRENLHDREFLARHCTGFDTIERQLRAIPVEDYVRRADVPLADAERVARGFAQAKRGCVRIDLGIQHTLHTTLNGYLEKLLYLITGSGFGVRDGNWVSRHLPAGVSLRDVTNRFATLNMCGPHAREVLQKLDLRYPAGDPALTGFTVK